MTPMTLKIPASAPSFYDFLVNKIRGDRSLTPDLVSRSQGRRLFTLSFRFKQFLDWLDTRRPDGIEAAYSASTPAILILTAQDWRSLYRNIPQWAHHPAEGATAQSQSSRGNSRANASIHPTLDIMDYSFPPHGAPLLSAARADSMISTHQLPSPVSRANDDLGASTRPRETAPFLSSWKSPSVPVAREMPPLVTLTPDSRRITQYGGVDPTPAPPSINHHKPDLGDKSASSSDLPGDPPNQIPGQLMSLGSHELPSPGTARSQQNSVEHAPNTVRANAKRMMLPQLMYEPLTIRKVPEKSLAHRDVTSVRDITESTNVHVSTNSLADLLPYSHPSSVISQRHHPTASIPPLDPTDNSHPQTPVAGHAASLEPFSRLWRTGPESTLLQSRPDASTVTEGVKALGQGTPSSVSAPPAVRTAPREQASLLEGTTQRDGSESQQLGKHPRDPDLEVLAVEVFRLLKSRLAVERERLVGFI